MFPWLVGRVNLNCVDSRELNEACLMTKKLVLSPNKAVTAIAGLSE
jgi:hypothetical protein